MFSYKYKWLDFLLGSQGGGDNLLKGEIQSQLAVLVHCSVHKHS